MRPPRVPRIRRRRSPHAEYARARRRLGRIDTPSVIGWSDQVGTEVLIAIDAYRRSQSHDAIKDAQSAANVLLAVCDELAERYVEKKRA